MSDFTPLEELAARFNRIDALGLPVAEELGKLISIAPSDFEMAMVRGRRIVDMVIRALFAKHIARPGTRPLAQLLPELERSEILPREIVAHVRSLKEVANLPAHEANVAEEGLAVCLIHLEVVLKWFARYVEATQSRSQKIPVADGTVPEPKRDKKIRESMMLLKPLLLGLATTAILIALKVWFENTHIGHRIELTTFQFLQSQLSPFSSSTKLPVLVVDIRSIPGDENKPTSRATLKEILSAIADQRPKGIGVDIDFSPNERGWVLDDDPKFFDFCIQLRDAKKVPIFLAVYRARGEPADAWLGIAKYQSLAAAGVVGNDTTRVPRWVKSSRSSIPLPSLGLALAQAYHQPLPSPPIWLAPAIEVARHDQQHGVERHIGGGITIADTLVNYSKLNQLKHETVATVSARSIREEGAKFRGKMVLLGDASKALDSYVVPGRAEVVPGVYLLASAAYTLAVEPVYELKKWIRFVIDLTTALCILAGTAWIRFRLSGHPQALRRRLSRFIFGTIATVIALGVLLVGMTAVMWLDFLLVVLALFLHPAVGPRIGSVAERTKVVPRPPTI